MAESKNIKELLKMMLEARYGKDVRSAIHDSIEQCVDYTEDSLNYVSDFRDEYYPKVMEAVKNSSDNAEKTAADVKQVKTYADKASSSAASASTSASSASQSATAAADSADDAESYAASWKGSLLPQGVVAFSELPTSGLVAGHLYAVKDKFITDSRFEEGAGHPYPQGTCVYWTKDNKWKVLSGVLSLELTKAEYDALTDAQKKNGTIYYVKDADNFIEADEINGLAVVATSGNYNDLKNKPSSLPASDVSDWAKAKTKPSYTAGEVGLGNVGNFKAVSTVANQGLPDSEKSNARANIGAQAAGSYAASTHTHDDRYYTETEINTKLQDKAEKNHTHSQYLTSHQDISGKIDNTATGANSLLSKITANWTAAPTDDTYFIQQDTGGKNEFGRVKFSTLLTYIKSKLSKVAASGSYNDLKNKPSSLPASDVSDWAKAKTKPSYTAGEVGLGNVGNFKAVSTVANQGLPDSEKSNARANIGAQAAGSYAASTHTHDDRYYTETEINTKLQDKAEKNHTHSQYLTSHQDISGKIDNTATGANSLLSKITASWTAAPTDDTYLIRQDTGGKNEFGRVKFSTLLTYIKSKLSKVAASGSYNDLSNKPTIPAIKALTASQYAALSEAEKKNGTIYLVN